MDVLPNEILEQIFGYLTIEERLLSIRDVCQLWRDVVDFSSEWTTFKLRMDGGILKAQMLELMPSLQRLTINQIDRYAQNALSRSSAMLHHLIVLKQEDPKLIAELISRSSNTLQRLYLHVETFGDAACAKAIANCPILQVLELMEVSRYRQFDDSLLIIAGGVVPLTKFRFRRNMFSDHSLHYLLHRKRKTLKVLDIYIWPNISEEFQLRDTYWASTWNISSYCGFQWMKTAMLDGFLVNLRELKLDRYSCSNEDYSLAKLILCNCPSLNLLKLPRYIKVKNDDLKDVTCLQLTRLMMWGAEQVTAEGLRHVSLCKQLQTLTLNSSQPGRVGELALLQMSNLRCLSFRHAQFSNNFFKTLPLKLTELRKLTVMKLSDDNHSYLIQRMPNLTIREELP